jgi:hypothetical protein
MSVALPTSSASEFAEQQYWDTFFVEVRSLTSVTRSRPLRRLGALTDRHTRTQRGSKPFEWYSAWRQLRPLFRVAVGAGTAAPPHGGRLLVVGCGNSELSAQLYDDGFTNIVNIDFSKVRVLRLL